MIDKREKLKILYFDGTSFSDFSSKLAQMKDEFEVETILNSSSFLYVGFHKPIKNFYAAVFESSTSNEKLVFEIFKNGSWEEVTATDETFAFKKSGFISLQEEMTEATINDETLYFIRISCSSEITFKLSAISMLLCSIKDLEAVYPPISNEDFLLGKKSLHVAMELTKNNIIQHLRNKPTILKDDRRLAVFDLLDIQELRQAAAYKTVANVLRNNFNATDDKFYILSNDFFKKAEELLDVFYLTVDLEDDSIPKKTKSSSTFSWELKR